tara:strand:+ start:684 stop:1058 length:375 start_codon:yes stop_codon:yes gene_type:complete
MDGKTDIKQRWMQVYIRRLIMKYVSFVHQIAQLVDIIPGRLLMENVLPALQGIILKRITNGTPMYAKYVQLGIIERTVVQVIIVISVHGGLVRLLVIRDRINVDYNPLHNMCIEYDETNHFVLW